MDAVRLLSVHKSKGLEFPIVVVADLARKWNARDLSKEILLDEELGLAPRVVDPVSGLRFPSVAQWLARRRARRESLGEEIRLLYVAFTRAKDRLILVGSAKPKGWSLEEEDANTSADDTNAAGSADILDIDRAKSALDWLAMWWRLERTRMASGDGRWGSSEQLSWHVGGVEFSEPQTVMPLTANLLEPELSVEQRSELMESVLARLSWAYPNAGAAREPAKTTVSALRRRGRDLDSDAAESSWVSRVPALVRPPHARSGADELSAAERGTAHHAFQQWVNLARTESTLDLRNEANRLVALGVLTEEEIASLDFRGLEAFWSSQLGREIRSHQGRVHRETPFTARLTIADLRGIGAVGIDAELSSEEFVVVQGQVDLIVLLDAELWLIDFKTDKVEGDAVIDRANHYRTQMLIYAHALEAIYGRPVTRRVLYFIAAQQAVEASGESV